jgi:hypothetical protein
MRCLVTEKMTRVGEYMAGRNRPGGLAVANGLLILAEKELGIHQRGGQVIRRWSGYRDVRNLIDALAAPRQHAADGQNCP